MADDWWDSLLERLFGAQVAAQNARGKSFIDMGHQINTEMDRQDQAANGPAAPTPTPTAAQQQQANPNLRESEQLQANVNNATAGVAKENPLYGNLPNGYAYLGTERSERGKGTEKFVKKDKFASIQEVMAEVNEWSTKKREKFAELAVDAGLLKAVTTNYDELEPILGQLAVRSAKLYERGVKVTPWSLLERYGKAGGVDGSNGPVTTTTVNKSINLTSPREADALVDAALQQRLGRSPTEKEKKAFLAALNSSEKKEPTVTKSTTTTTGSGTENVSNSTSSNTSGGVDVGAFAREWSMEHNKDEAGSYQALSTYMPAFFSALEAPV